MKKLTLALSILAAVAVTPAPAWADPGSSSSGSGSDLSSVMQTALQIAQQTYTQAMQMLSNIMKTDSDTSSSIVGNLKN
jgi:hypothetical protein